MHTLLRRASSRRFGHYSAPWDTGGRKTKISLGAEEVHRLAEHVDIVRIAAAAASGDA
jgi:hypothetical protein